MSNVLHGIIVRARVTSNVGAFIKGQRVHVGIVIVGPLPGQDLRVRQHGVGERQQEQLRLLAHLFVANMHGVFDQEEEERRRDLKLVRAIGQRHAVRGSTLGGIMEVIVPSHAKSFEPRQ